MDGMLNGIITKAADILTTITTKINEWIQAIKAKVNDFISAGGSLIDGLKQGFQNKLSSVTTAISNGAKSIADAAKSALGINSPSKVFAEIGAGCVEGLEVGWDKNIKSVQNDINKDMEFKGSINTEFTNNNAKTTSSSDNNGTRIVINETINLPSGDTKEVFYEYVVQTEGDKTRAVKIAQGGY
jgi:phage-related protein